MEKGIKIVKKAREVKKYDTLDAALKAKNDEARAYLKNVKWPKLLSEWKRFYVKIPFTNFPCTSVKRKRRP